MASGLPPFSSSQQPVPDPIPAKAEIKADGKLYIGGKPHKVLVGGVEIRGDQLYTIEKVKSLLDHVQLQGALKSGQKIVLNEQGISLISGSSTTPMAHVASHKRAVDTPQVSQRYQQKFAAFKEHIAQEQTTQAAINELVGTGNGQYSQSTVQQALKNILNDSPDVNPEFLATAKLPLVAHPFSLANRLQNAGNEGKLSAVLKTISDSPSGAFDASKLYDCEVELRKRLSGGAPQYTSVSDQNKLLATGPQFAEAKSHGEKFLKDNLGLRAVFGDKPLLTDGLALQCHVKNLGLHKENRLEKLQTEIKRLQEEHAIAPQDRKNAIAVQIYGLERIVADHANYKFTKRPKQFHQGGQPHQPVPPQARAPTPPPNGPSQPSPSIELVPEAQEFPQDGQPPPVEARPNEQNPQSSSALPHSSPPSNSNPPPIRERNADFQARKAALDQQREPESSSESSPRSDSSVGSSSSDGNPPPLVSPQASQKPSESEISVSSSSAPIKDRLQHGLSGAATSIASTVSKLFSRSESGGSLPAPKDGGFMQSQGSDALPLTDRSSSVTSPPLTTPLSGRSTPPISPPRVTIEPARNLSSEAIAKRYKEAKENVIQQLTVDYSKFPSDALAQHKQGIAESMKALSDPERNKFVAELTDEQRGVIKNLFPQQANWYLLPIDE